jgi:ferredoxin
MTQSPQYRIVALLIAAGCVAVTVVAIFTGGTSAWQESAWQDVEDMSLSSLFWPDAQSTVSTVMKEYACPQCGTGIDWGSVACPQCGSFPAGLMNPAALQAAAATPAARTLLSPREQNAAGKEFIEGHWLGLEVIPLAPELATEYQIPKGETGVLVDEITLEAAESGILAGDMVQSIDGRPTSDLRAFFLATQNVQEKKQAAVAVSRRGDKMTFVIESRNTKVLGFAQMEAAQPIQPGAISPHRSRGRACTACHIIMRTGGQLPTDAGDILPNPPPITRDAKAPHRYRGQCSSCHVIIRQGWR